jgi:hypothetical protein
MYLASVSVFCWLPNQRQYIATTEKGSSGSVNVIAERPCLLIPTALGVGYQKVVDVNSEDFALLRTRRTGTQRAEK